MSTGYQPVNIYCSSCGAPASFDIAAQVYRCQYCGAQTGISEPLAEKRGFRQFHRETLRRTRQEHPLVTCECTGCGARVVFPAGEALTDCAFCGRSLARREYLGEDSFPEILIPFRITREEARSRLLDWCVKNRGKREANAIRAHIDELSGFYLPYELVKGPTDCTVNRQGVTRSYHCRGFLDGSFVNTSRHLDNLLLDGMEPYDLSDLREFDFSYLAGQRVKIRDLNEAETATRVREEVAADYEPYLAKVMETRAITVTPSTGALVQLSAVLPAYYLRAGNTIAAVNGQTGKVAVREEKDRFLLPWWLRPIGWTAVVSAAIWFVMLLFGAAHATRMLVTGLMAAFLLIVLFTAYHNEFGGEKRWQLRRRIFTSDKTTQPLSPPIFVEYIDRAPQLVDLRFTTPLRAAKMLGLTLGTVFLPLILAFLFNGCSAAGLDVRGAAVWLCITVPVAPVYLLKFGRLDLYQNPLIWVRTPDGRRIRHRGARTGFFTRLAGDRELAKPVCIAAAVALVILIINVYLILHWD